jgi:dihydrofolate reductase
VKHTFSEAVEYAESLDSDEIFIGGGTEVYAQGLPQVGRLYLTLIDDEKDADTFFPKYEKEFTKKTFEEKHEWNGIAYTWVPMER